MSKMKRKNGSILVMNIKIQLAVGIVNTTTMYIKTNRSSLISIILSLQINKCLMWF